MDCRANSLDDPLKRGQRQVETVKLIVGMQIDDTNFRNQLLTSQVLSTKEHSRWSFDILFELFEGGPLLNAKRLDEATRATKFMRRVLGFYHPYNNRYSNLRKDAVRLKSLLRILLFALTQSSDVDRTRSSGRDWL